MIFLGILGKDCDIHGRKIALSGSGAKYPRSGACLPWRTRVCTDSTSARTRSQNGSQMTILCINPGAVIVTTYGNGRRAIEVKLLKGKILKMVKRERERW